MTHEGIKVPDVSGIRKHFSTFIVYLALTLT